MEIAKVREEIKKLVIEAFLGGFKSIMRKMEIILIFFLFSSIPQVNAFSTAELELSAIPIEKTLHINYNIYGYEINESNSRECKSWEGATVNCTKIFRIILQNYTLEGGLISEGMGITIPIISKDITWWDLSIGSSVEMLIEEKGKEFRTPPGASFILTVTAKGFEKKIEVEKTYYDVTLIDSPKKVISTKLRLSRPDIITSEKIRWFPFDKYSATLDFQTPIKVDQLRLRIMGPTELKITNISINSTYFKPLNKFTMSSLSEYYPASLPENETVSITVEYARMEGFLEKFFLASLILIVPLFVILYFFYIWKRPNTRTQFEYFSFIFLVIAIRGFMPYPAYVRYPWVEIIFFGSIIIATLLFWYSMLRGHDNHLKKLRVG